MLHGSRPGCVSMEPEMDNRMHHGYMEETIGHGQHHGCGMDPIIEQPIERYVQRDICHEVEHICPINTKIINNHIYHHTYRPCHTCSEHNMVTNIDQGSCCRFL